MAQAVSLGCYALLYRRVLASLGARVPFWLTARVTLASFLVSHVTPYGSAAGTVLNVSTLETEGVATSTTGEAIGLTSLVSTLALIALFGTGLVATAGRHLAHTYLVIAGAALALVVSVLAIHGKAGQAADHAHAQMAVVQGRHFGQDAGAARAHRTPTRRARCEGGRQTPRRPRTTRPTRWTTRPGPSTRQRWRCSMPPMPAPGPTPGRQRRRPAEHARRPGTTPRSAP